MNSLFKIELLPQLELLLWSANLPPFFSPIVQNSRQNGSGINQYFHLMMSIQITISITFSLVWDCSIASLILRINNSEAHLFVYLLVHYRPNYSEVFQHGLPQSHKSSQIVPGIF